ncbi:hypothetical protein KHS38_07665 [Mucilaginibacter sp. Bleaf8]|uniref:hypothetical protein n=1 Tax=Mucilaginibacter sp. Bleaf8 TaxID=2834430 RepID=UPI001BCF34E5|nr:hypothetical protein [Mucilaginibacter sp. Bleaf8]MBS7564279.1 hypothetical protein [Mucilaginibacter sp. Bleaf8]
MKKAVFTLTFLVAALLSSQAQTLSNHACWVVESNRHAKAQTVKFYDENQQLVYEEMVSIKLNISKKKVQQALNMILTNLLNKDGFMANKNVVAASFHTSR